VVARADDFNQGGSLELGIPLSRMACASRVTPGIGSLSIPFWPQPVLTIRDAKAVRWIVSRIGIVEPMCRAVPGEGKTAHRAVVLYHQNAEIPVAVLNGQLGTTKQR